MPHERSGLSPARGHLAAALLGGLAVFLVGSTAIAQGGGADSVSMDLAVNGLRLRAAMVLGQSALDRLQGPGAAEELPSIHQTIDTMYKTVRLAMFGMMERRKFQRLDDPILDYTLTKTTKAWNTIRKPADRYFDSPPPDVYIETAIRDLSAAMADLRPVIAVLP